MSNEILFSVTTVSRSTSILSFTKRSLRIIILQTAMLIPYNAVIIWQLDEKIIFIFAITATKTKCQCSIVYLVFIKRLPTSFWCIRLFTKNFAYFRLSAISGKPIASIVNKVHNNYSYIIKVKSATS